LSQAATRELEPIMSLVRTSLACMQARTPEHWSQYHPRQRMGQGDPL